MEILEAYRMDFAKELIKRIELNKRDNQSPPKSHNIDLYIFRKRMDTDQKYADFMTKELAELNKRKLSSKDDFIRNQAIYLWRNERSESIQEMKQYISLAIEKQQASDFHIIAIGLWMAWIDEYLTDDSLIELILCISKQVKATKILPSTETKTINEGGAPTTVDGINELMFYIKSGGNLAKTTKLHGKSEKTIREQLKLIIGDDFKNILKPEHKYYEICQVAYKYWLADYSNRG